MALVSVRPRFRLNQNASARTIEGENLPDDLEITAPQYIQNPPACRDGPITAIAPFRFTSLTVEKRRICVLQIVYRRSLDDSNSAVRHKMPQLSETVDRVSQVIVDAQEENDIKPLVPKSLAS